MRWQTNARLVALGGALVACSSDAACVFYPCPMPEAATVSVTAPNAPDGISGLVASVTGRAMETVPCAQASVSVCHIQGGTGNYQVQLSAPGYRSAQLNLTITGTDAGCNTCGHVNRQDLAVVLEPSN